MAIQELPVWPQITFSESQGMIGTRRWAIDHDNDLDLFLFRLSDSHFPGYPDSIPVQMQAGPFWEGVKIECRDSEHARTLKNLGDTPTYGKSLVVVQYALHRLTNCWPDIIPKPYHPSGTTLSLQVHGSGQILLITPAGMKFLASTAVCTGSSPAVPGSVAAKLILPVTEYRITCDRLTLAQVNTAFAVRDWNLYQGSVNSVEFLGAPIGTLLFDGYTINETFVCDQYEQRRYALSATLKRRVITDSAGAVLLDDDPDWYQQPIGWNHDYVPKVDANGKTVKKWGWKFIQMMQGDTCLPRYPILDYSGMFGGTGSAECNPTEVPGSTFNECQ